MLTPAQADKVGKLLRLLGSSVPGEVVAAAAALRRALTSAGYDLADLADSLTRLSPDDDWPATARWCLAQGADQSAREINFLENMARRVVLPSERQIAWLRAIYARLQSL
jgi:hypothetical protein